jgi:DNA polymerase III subunit epsilon
MREIVFDTETTGLDALKGDRLIEIGCVEIVNRFLTGRVFHAYLNPERPVHPDAFAVHGLSDAFLADKPKFAAIADEFLAFIGDDPLVAHNASFDMSFLNMELKKLGRPALSQDRVIDTLQIARRRHPGQKNTLDALCERYGIDNARRTKHGALLDSELLAEVYGELTGGKQAALLLGAAGDEMPGGQAAETARNEARKVALRPIPLMSEEERAAHRAFIGEMGAKALWNAYWPQPAEPENAKG